MPTPTVSLDDKQRLLDVLAEIPRLQEVATRDLYVRALEEHLGRALTVPRYDDLQHDLWSVVTGCLEYSGGLRSLVRIIEDFTGPSPELTELQRRLEDLEQGTLISDADRDVLYRMLSELVVTHVATAAGGLLEETAPPNWRDVPALVRRLEERPVRPDSVPPLVTFVDRLAHTVGGVKSLELHRWINLVAGGLGIAETALRNLCVESQRDALTTSTGVGEPELLVTPPELHQDGVSLGEFTQRPQELRLIWGGVPNRNPNFTGRVDLLAHLHATLQGGATASVLPQTLHGLGGVGKTQLVVEYVYQHSEAYDVVWWIPAEQASAVLESLSELGLRLGRPPGEDMTQTAGMVLDELASSPLRWLLVYDNADRPEDLEPYLPSSRGQQQHVILTSRNQDWAGDSDAIEVDVFTRDESIELLQKRGKGISEVDADALAEKLGDLPLALEQAAAWQAATGMPVREYVELFDNHVQELLSEGKPTSYPVTIAAFTDLAVERLRRESPATAELMELFAFLGPEPVSVPLLRSGREADISEPLRRALREPIELRRTVRELRRYGLARVDPNGQRIQVHRLVQKVLRESLPPELARQTLRNVQNLLESANPGDPDDQPDWTDHSQIAPHVQPAMLLRAESLRARQVLLDHIRYLYVIGDYEHSRERAQEAVDLWQQEAGDRLGPDGELTLVAARHLANAMRSLGDSASAAALTADTFERLVRHPDFGEDHEYTLLTATQVARDFRIAGDFHRAMQVDEDNYERHREVFGDGENYTLRAKGNLAVNLRMLGDFLGAYDLDSQVVEAWRRTFGPSDIRALFWESNVARDLYGLGRYRMAMDMQGRTLPRYRDLLGSRHSNVLLAERTYAMALHKVGDVPQARKLAEECHRNFLRAFGGTHEHTLAAATTYANTLRADGAIERAYDVLVDAHKRYEIDFGVRHPLTFLAAVNLGIVLRALGRVDDARALDDATCRELPHLLGAEHPYTLCALSNLANDLAMAGDHAAARELSGRVLETSRRVRPEDHLHHLACTRNHGLDLLAVGEEADGQELLAWTIAALGRTVGPEHPEAIGAAQRRRAECDVEPPPT
jgi:tetratricopeptide (TPR) repeat protein